MRNALVAAGFAILLVGAAALAARWCTASPRLGPGRAVPGLAEGKMQCRAQREAAERQESEALRRRQIALVARLEGADPVRDAAEAAARGDFRLVRAVAMTGVHALGVDCRTPAFRASGVPPLTLATRFHSDVAGSCETGGGGDPCRTEKLLDAYGPAYNRAIVSNPLYPYGDLCRASVAAGGPPPRMIADPVDYGFPDLARTDAPHDLHEAARRGTATAVERMIAAAGADGVDRADPYGLTPLAWAVIRRRPDVAARLLAAGASPTGRRCDEPDRPESPLRLALMTGQEALARRMLTPAAMEDLRPWPAGLVEAAARGGSASLLARMLREEREGAAADRLGRPGEALPASSLAVLRDYAAGLCWRHGLPANARVRMIGVYEGRNDSGSRDRHGMGVVTVALARSSRPVLLVLSAYEPVDWRIASAPGTRLAGVIAVGMHRPRVTGAAAGVPVLINDQRDRCPAMRTASLYVYQPGEEQERLADAIELMVVRPVEDFEGSYSGTAFELR
jgi:hypothetical protein